MSREPRLDLLKALGDDTRYAIYLELSRSDTALSTADVAETLALHVNTVRPHLERMRNVGLLAVCPDSRGAVGRPQKLYSIAADAPGLGLEPPLMSMLSRMLLQVAVDSGAQRDEVLDAGRRAGTNLSRRHQGKCCTEALISALEQLGFDPAAATEAETTSVAFGNCPFSELAEDEPQVICSLHQGMMEGFASDWGDANADVTVFNDLSSLTPCTAEIVETVGPAS